jgi:hypothetical protein
MIGKKEEKKRGERKRKESIKKKKKIGERWPETVMYAFNDHHLSSDFDLMQI